jgi:hypothetical protein
MKHCCTFHAVALLRIEARTPSALFAVCSPPSDSRICKKPMRRQPLRQTLADLCVSPVAHTQLGGFKPKDDSPSEAIPDSCQICTSPQRHRRQTGSSHALSVASDDENIDSPSDTLFSRIRLVADRCLGYLGGFLQPARTYDCRIS